MALTVALAIARELGLAQREDQVVTGTDLRVLDQSELDHLTHKARVFARVEPRQKLAIVQSLQRNGHFVAVTGDGANDAPALRTAQVGVAMGRGGTDVRGSPRTWCSRTTISPPSSPAWRKDASPTATCAR